MDRTALLIGRRIRPSTKYNGPRAGVKQTTRAGFILALLCVVSFASVTTARAQDPDSLRAAERAREEKEREEQRDVFVNRILFVGNKGASTAELKARMRTHEPGFFSIFRKPVLDERQLRRDVTALEAYYRSIGYPDAVVHLDRIELLENRRFADIHISIAEGEPNLVSAVNFEGNLILEDKELRKDLLLEPGAPYNASLLETDVYTIRGKYFDQGYLAVTIADSVRIDSRRVDIRFYINPRQQLKVGEISIDGNEEVRTGVIKSEITVKPGEVCRYKKVLETERNLFETGLFSVVDVVPEHVDTLTNVVDIRIRVRERKESWVEAGFGVGNVLGSRVFAEWGTRNVLGTGRTVRLKATYAFDLFRGDDIELDKFHVSNTYYRYDAIYQQRRIFGLKLPTGLNAYDEWDKTVPGLEVKTLGAAISVSHEYGKVRQFGREGLLVGSFSVEDIQSKQADSLGVITETRSRSNILGGSASRDTRDFVLNPTVGSYRVLSSQVAGGVLGGKNDFYTLESSYQHYYGVGTVRETEKHFVRQSVFAWRVRAGYADSYGRSAEVPVENRYFAGGSNSVRGYIESGLGPHDGATALGGDFLLLANVEIRYPLPYVWRWNFTGAVFLDSGNVWADISDVGKGNFKLASSADETGPNDYRYGTGIGIRYNTPIGPIRLDWGFPLKRDHLNDPGSGVVYLSLGQIF